LGCFRACLKTLSSAVFATGKKWPGRYEFNAVERGITSPPVATSDGRTQFTLSLRGSCRRLRHHVARPSSGQFFLPQRSGMWFGKELFDFLF
jgi:hypothetical protein